MGCCGCISSAPLCLPSTLNLVIVGLDNAGKTTLVSTLQGQQCEAHPTIGFSKPVSVKHKRHRLKIYDLGGGRGIRAIWAQYLPEVHGIIFVVDAANKERIAEAADEFSKMLQNDSTRNKHILVLANKQDQPNALPPEMIDADLPLHALPYALVKVVGCTAKMKDGNPMPDIRIHQALDWLVNGIRSDVRSVTRRVRAEHAQYLAQEEQKRRQRLERGKQQKNNNSNTSTSNKSLSKGVLPLDLKSISHPKQGSGTRTLGGSSGDAKVTSIPAVHIQTGSKRIEAIVSSGSLLGGPAIATTSPGPSPVCEEIEIIGRRSPSDSDTASDILLGDGSSFLSARNLAPVSEACDSDTDHEMVACSEQHLRSRSGACSRTEMFGQLVSRGGARPHSTAPQPCFPVISARSLRRTAIGSEDHLTVEETEVVEVLGKENYWDLPGY